MRTIDEFGRWGGASGERPTVDLLVLNRARTLFAGLSRSLQGEIDRLEAARDTETDEARIGRLTRLVRMNRKALRSVLDQEARIGQQAEPARGGRDVIDLGDARAEIARRLARLAG